MRSAKVPCFLLVPLLFTACPEPAKKMLPLECSVFIGRCEARPGEKREVSVIVSIPRPSIAFTNAKLTITAALDALKAPGKFDVELWKGDLAGFPWIAPVAKVDATAKIGIRIRIELDLDSLHLDSEEGVALTPDSGLDHFLIVLRPPAAERDLHVLSPQPSLGGKSGGKLKIKFTEAPNNQVAVSFDDYEITSLESSNKLLTTMRVWQYSIDPQQPQYLACRASGTGYFLKETIQKTLGQLPHPYPPTNYQRMLKPENGLADIGSDVRILAIIEEKNGLLSTTHYFFWKDFLDVAEGEDEWDLDGGNGYPCTWPPGT